MRIDAYNVISQVYQTNVPKASGKGKGKGALSDSLQISNVARDYQVAKNAVSSASDIRTEKVAAVKSMMEKGIYFVSSEDLTEKILSQTKTLAF